MTASDNDEVAYFRPDGDLRAHLRKAEAPDFWRRLNPQLTLSDDLFCAGAGFTFSEEEVQRAETQVREEGYFQTGPVIPRQQCDRLAQGILKIIEAGYHPLYVSVYDEFWLPFKCLGAILTPILGEGYALSADYWVWCVSGTTAGAGWGPHRDNQFKVPALRQDMRPVIITVWVPFTDATPLNGCVYIVPMNRDQNLYRDFNNQFIPNLQDIRALPAPAGSILGWNQYVLHWGSSFSKWAAGPRMSAGIYFQSADFRPSTITTVPTDRNLSLWSRLAYIGGCLLRYQKRYNFPSEIVEASRRYIAAAAFENMESTEIVKKLKSAKAAIVT